MSRAPDRDPSNRPHGTVSVIELEPRSRVDTVADENV